MGIADLSTADYSPIGDGDLDISQQTLTLAVGMSGVTITLPDMQKGKYYTLEVAAPSVVYDICDMQQSGIGLQIDRDASPDSDDEYTAKGIAVGEVQHYTFLCTENDTQYLHIGGYLVAADEIAATATITFSSLQLTAPTNLSTISIPYSYRYGFNGKENDNQVYGNGNLQDYGMRMYDTRTARFISVDPLTYGFPYLSTYQYAANSPIKYEDLDGGEPKDFMERWVHTSGESNERTTVSIMFWFEIFDKTTGKTWEVGQNPNSEKWYFYTSKADRTLSRSHSEPESMQKTDGQWNTTWQEFIPNSEYQANLDAYNKIADGIAIGTVGVLALPLLAEMGVGIGGASLTGRAISAGIDAGSQYITNGHNVDDINVTTVVMSGVFCKPTIGNFATVAAGGTAVNMDYKGNRKYGTPTQIGTNVGISLIAGGACGGLQSVRLNTSNNMLNASQRIGYHLSAEQLTSPKAAGLLNSYFMGRMGASRAAETGVDAGISVGQDAAENKCNAGK